MDSFSELWDLVCADMKLKVTETAYNVWLKPLEFIKYENEKITLKIKAEFMRNVILDKFSTTIRDSVENVFGFSVDVDIILPGDDPSNMSVPDSAAKNVQKKYDYSFENFVIGPTNKFAHAAAYNVANNPGTSYNPLFIYGHSGLGKTHLLCAIQKRILENNPDTNIIYTSGELFTNELIHYLTIKNMQAFHERYRNVDVLLIDDVQFIAKTNTTQEEFFHTFDYLYHAGKQIVITSDRPPKDMVSLTERVRNRFEMGLLADLQPPDFETRMAIIKRKAEDLNFNIPDEVCEFIANRLKNNIRQLEGVVKRLQAYNNFEKIPPSIALAQNAIKDILNSDAPVSVTVEKIINQVSETFGVSVEDMKSNKRTSNIIEARQIAMYIIREVTELSQDAIGKEFGGKDHTTVIYALSSVKRLMDKDTYKARLITDLINNIRGS